MHPGQYAQLGSPNESVVTQTIKDLNLHADILLAMGMTPALGSVIIIHGGGTFGDKPAAITRWKENFRKLPESTAQFIALENDEFQYSVLDLLPLCQELHIPLCVDFFHHEVSLRVGKMESFNIYGRDLLAKVLSTWKLRGIKPKCHYSEQRPDSRPSSHSDCISELPRSLILFAYENFVDIMLEVKHKDTCALEIYEKYFTRVVNQGRVEWYLRT
jgi:UV DNA damage endonuclease